MNILITFLTAKKNTFGGVEKSIFSLLDGLKKIGNKVIVYTSENGDNLENFYYSKYLNCNFNCEESEIDNNIRKVYKKYELEINNELEELIIQNKIDYILVIDQLWGIIPSINFKNKNNVKIGIVYHMTYQLDLIKDILNQNYNNYFAVSQDVKNKIIDYTYTCKRIDLLYNCYIEEEFNEFNNKEDNYIFCNSRLAEGKGIENLLEVYKKIAEEYSDLKLYLCGGEFHFGRREKIFEYINKFFKTNPQLKNNIKILNKLNWNEIPKYIKNSKLVILPTQYESFGIAALECIACCKPLITMKVGNIPNLVKNAGILLDYNDNEGLYNAITKVLNDNLLKNELIKNCKEVRKKYNSVYIANQLIKIIER